MRLLIAVPLVLCLATIAAAEPKITVVVEGLNNPTAVVQQKGGDLFVAESGAGRVVRIVAGKAEEAIVGSPLDKYGKGPIYDIGPLGLAFVDEKQLAVGDGGYQDGQECIRIFEVPARGAEAVKYDAAVTTLGPLAATQELKGEGNLYGLVNVPGQGLFVTCNGDDAKGWIARSFLNGTKWQPLTRHIATKEATGVNAPGGITLASDGMLVVGQMGTIDVAKDSRLTMYHPKTGKLLLNLETGLHDITGLGYSPKGLLYAVDFAWMAPSEGGLFRLDARKTDGGQAVKATRIATLDRPTAMCFAEGALYVTVLGSPKDGPKPGKLLKIDLVE